MGVAHQAWPFAALTRGSLAHSIDMGTALSADDLMRAAVLQLKYVRRIDDNEFNEARNGDLIIVAVFSCNMLEKKY